MSRNLGQTYCAFCTGDIRLLEKPRPITLEEAGPYFDGYLWRPFARAVCVDCEAPYLAWCDGHTGLHLVETPLGPIGDLSHYHAFNDEPAKEDLPKWRVTRTSTLKTWLPRGQQSEVVSSVREPCDGTEWWAGYAR